MSFYFISVAIEKCKSLMIWTVPECVLNLIDDFGCEKGFSRPSYDQVSLPLAAMRSGSLPTGTMKPHHRRAARLLPFFKVLMLEDPFTGTARAITADIIMITTIQDG